MEQHGTGQHGAAADRPEGRLPGGRRVQLPGRGTTWIRDLAGPPGAPTLILAHGLVATADLNWFTAYEGLTQRYRVVAIDHRGHGRGVRSLRPFTLQDCADDIAAMAKVVGIERAILVGYSMGGPISLLTAKRHPDLVSGLVLCATAARFGERTAAMNAVANSMLGASFAMRLSPGVLRRRAMEEMLRRRMASRPQGPMTDWAAEEFRRSDPAAILQAMSALATFDARDWVGKLPQPAAVVVTTLDQLVAPQRQRRMAELLHDATVHELHADHISAIAQADEFVAALRAALASVVARQPVTLP